MELYNHIPSNFTMFGKIVPQHKTKGKRREKKTMRSLTTFHMTLTTIILLRLLLSWLMLGRHMTTFQTMQKRRTKEKAMLMELNPSNNNHEQSIKRSPQQLVNYWVAMMLKLKQTSSRIWQN